MNFFVFCSHLIHYGLRIPNDIIDDFVQFYSKILDSLMKQNRIFLSKGDKLDKGRQSE